MGSQGRKRKSLGYLVLLIPFLLGHCLAVAIFLQVTLSFSKALSRFQKRLPFLVPSGLRARMTLSCVVSPSPVGLP